MRNRLFDPDGGLMISLTQLTDTIFLSLFFILGCIPVLTIGASFAALYDSAFRAFRKGEKNSWSRFIKVYKDNWKTSVLPTLVFLLLAWALVKAAVSLWNSVAGGNMSWLLFSALTMLCVLGLGMLCFLFPVLSRFESGFFSLLKNTLLLSLANLPRALALGLINALALILCLRFVVPLFFLPAIAALLGSFIIEPTFAPYMPEKGLNTENN